MQNPATSMMQSYQHQLDTSRHIGDAVFDSAERIEHLIIDTTRKAFDEQMKFYQALAAARDPQGIAALQTAFFAHTPEQMTKVQEELVQMVTDAQHKIVGTMAQYKTTLNGSASSAMNDAMSAFNQSPNDSPATSALTGVYSMWDKAFKETFAMANRSMATVLTPTKAAANGAVEKGAGATATRKGSKRR